MYRVPCCLHEEKKKHKVFADEDGGVNSIFHFLKGRVTVVEYSTRPYYDGPAVAT